jgi:hypothetical protein
MEITLTRALGDALEGSLEFDEMEHSFRFTPASPMDLAERVDGDGLTSLLIGTLQVEVAVATGTLLFVWGLHPRASWSERSIGSPTAASGLVRVARREILASGVSLGIADVGVWSTSFDAETGWVRASATDEPDDTQVLIATDTVLGLRGRHLNSIWLCPEFV